MAICDDYAPWNQATENPLATRECMSWDYIDGLCGDDLSPHGGQKCPWAGRPDLEQKPETNTPADAGQKQGEQDDQN